MPEIKFVFNNKIFQIYDLGGYESRNQSTMTLLIKAWNLYIRNNEVAVPFREITIWTDDHKNPEKTFSYAVDAKSSNKAVPDHVFCAWPEVGIHKYQTVFENILSKSHLPPTENKIFWRGAPNPIRKMAEMVSEHFPDLIDVKCFEWNNENKDSLYKKTQSYISLPEHCKYSALIDLPGAGYSGRLPLLLATGRPIIIVGRPNEQWFYWDKDFIPWKHYIPCGSKDSTDVTPNDILQSCIWIQNNFEHAYQIGQEGKKYALENFSPEAVILRIANLLKSVE